MLPLTVMSLNVQPRAREQGRWTDLANIIRAINPHLLMLQGAEFLADRQVHADTEEDLGLQIEVAPSRHLPTAVAYRALRLPLVGIDIEDSRDLYHGYCAPRHKVVGVGKPVAVPLVAISTHLIPQSAQRAAQEAQIVGPRASQHGGLGVIGGHIGHPPVGDPEPDWDTVPDHQRMAWCQRGVRPWQADTIVGQTLADGGLIDVAGYLADHRDDVTLRAPTTRYSGVRTGQVHVTPALEPAIVDYHQVNTGGLSDHDAIVVILDLNRVDTRRLGEHT